MVVLNQGLKNGMRGAADDHLSIMIRRCSSRLKLCGIEMRLKMIIQGATCLTILRDHRKSADDGVCCCGRSFEQWS